jgi:integrase
MSEVKFYLEKRKDKETGEPLKLSVPIHLFYSFNGQRLQYYTGLRIDKAKWDEEAMQVRRNCTEASEYNRELTRLKAKVEDIEDKAKALDEELTIDYFKERLSGKQKVTKTKKNFQEYLDEFEASSKHTKGQGTLNAIKSSFNIFAEFSKHEGIKLDFKNINQKFYDAFLDYCFTEKDYKNGYTGKLIKDLKAFLNWATDRGYNTNFDFKKKSFKKLTEEPEIIFLTYEELMLLYKYDLEDNTRLDQIRDTFCFCCFAGMRFSDVLALAPEHIQKDFINYRIVKTNQNNTIPLNPYTKAILKKYKDKLLDKCLPVISEQKTNEYLKELFKKVELNRKVQKVNFQGAKRIKVTAPLSEVITFHISKKTFMTNFLTKGGSLLTAMSITGNRDLRTARRYYKVVDTLKAEEMAKVFGK